MDHTYLKESDYETFVFDNIDLHDLSEEEEIPEEEKICLSAHK
jgi:hypothetical protein